MPLIDLIYFSSSLVLVGLILVVHFVHYPSFPYIHEARFSEFESFHKVSITKIVLPLMLCELISGVILFMKSPTSLFWISQLSIILLIWILTFFFAVPAHNRLSKGFCQDSFVRLMKVDLLRTLLWLSKAVTLMGLHLNSKIG